MVGSKYADGATEDQIKIMTLEELLPYSFGPEELEKPRL
jgi:cytidine deaminase